MTKSKGYMRCKMHSAEFIGNKIITFLDVKDIKHDLRK